MSGRYKINHIREDMPKNRYCMLKSVSFLKIIFITIMRRDWNYSECSSKILKQ